MKHPCETIRKQLADYLEQNLEPTAAQAVEAHLEACEACRAECHRLARVPELLQHWAPPVPTEAIWRGVQVRLRQKRLFMPRKVYALIGSAAAVLALVAFWQWWSRPTPPPALTQMDMEPFYRAHLDWAPHTEAVNLHLSLSSRGEVNDGAR
ncbi:MAG: zf-HC2 domain-containing protein [Fimbriimonadales bacterium]|jgi:predicted anti-sigma-YlaC factor YlaD|nr:zf-HC2 domain-containing protein [Fimbriimonadales bacterium]GBC89702.1 hypothetical protein HRbin14_00430 [bacterium HR14]GIV12054.1 MAG: hypothetical protein KatS3mg021_0336 [Fimbriimonadales bacterium]CUU02180.1 Putative zinc-finger [Armatimonadetes bacterium GBS]CUU36381.1 Putative zinc-finger [Armatimonadetes bacterium GXS]